MVESAVPKLLHWLWLGPAPLPDEHAVWIDGWRRLHPGWACRLWRDTDLPPLANQTAFDAASSFAQKADIARYELILSEGGVYVDTDFECLKPIEPLLTGISAFAAEEEPGRVANGLFGASAGHPWLDDVVLELPASFAQHDKIEEQTGPGLLARVTDRRRDVVRFPPEYFYPYNWKEPDRASGPFPHAFAVHRYAHSWKADQDAQLRRRSEALTQALELKVPPDARLLYASDREAFAPPRGVPTTALVDLFGGAPPGSGGQAISAVRAARGAGTVAVAFVWSARWWLDHYRDFAGFLHAEGELACDEPNLVVFVLEKHRAAAERPA